jgi:hypothetical protein
MDAEAVAAMTGSVDFATIITGIAAVAAVLILPKVAMKGARMVLSMIR